MSDYQQAYDLIDQSGFHIGRGTKEAELLQQLLDVLQVKIDAENEQ